jgi:hypothetical protein
MKNQIELPREKDFHETSVVDYSGALERPGHEKDVVLYRKANVNLRTITDFTEAKVNLTVLDSEKFPEFEKKEKEWQEQMERFRASVDPGGPSPFPMAEFGGFSAPPEFPSDAVVKQPGARVVSIGPLKRPVPEMKTITIKGTYILYYNGAQRMIVDDFNDFKETYFNYLNAQKLDM